MGPDAARTGNQESPGRAGSLELNRFGSFAEAHRIYYPRVFAFMHSLLRDTEIARSLTDRVFNKAYSEERGLADADFETWVFALARRVIAHHERTPENDAPDRNGGEGTPPPAGSAQDDKIRALMIQVCGLPRLQQELLALRFDAVLSTQQIASVMRMTETDVRVSIYDALKRLHRLMEGME